MESRRYARRWFFVNDLPLDFSTLSPATQSQLLGQSVERIQSVLGVRTKCFIPPFNGVNSDTFAALVSNGFTIVSSEVDQDPAPYNNATNPPSNGLWRYPIQAATAVLNQDGYYVGVPANTTLIQVQTQIAKFGFAVCCCKHISLILHHRL